MVFEFFKKPTPPTESEILSTELGTQLKHEFEKHPITQSFLLTIILQKNYNELCKIIEKDGATTISIAINDQVKNITKNNIHWNNVYNGFLD